MRGRPLLLFAVLAAPASVSGLHAQAATWTIDPAPSVVIGASANDPADQLGRVLAVGRFADGTIAILDGLLSSVRLYGPDGRHIRDIGRQGDGPGEFTDPTDLEIVEGDLVVIDAAGRRTWFDRDGRVLRTDRIVIAPMCPEDYNARQGGLLPDGGLLVRCEERMFGRADGEYRATVELLRERPGADPQRLGRFASDTGRTDAQGVAVPRPYVPSTKLLTAAAGERVFAVTPDRAVVHVVSRAPSSQYSVDVPAPRRPVSDRDVEEAVDEMLRYVVESNDRRVVGEWARGMPRSARTPAVRALLAAGPGEAWVETWEPAHDGAKWVIVDASTAAAAGPLASTRAPRGLQLRAIGDDWVLGLWRDEFGVEQVRIHPLGRG